MSYNINVTSEMFQIKTLNWNIRHCMLHTECWPLLWTSLNCHSATKLRHHFSRILSD